MWCDFPREELSAFHDRELDAAATAAADTHIAGCRGCRDELARMERVDAAVRAPVPVVRARFRDRALGRPAPKARDLRRAATVAILLAVAAGVVAFLVLRHEGSGPRLDESTSALTRQDWLIQSLVYDTGALRIELAANAVPADDAGRLRARLDELSRRVRALESESTSTLKGG